MWEVVSLLKSDRIYISLSQFIATVIYNNKLSIYGKITIIY